MDIEQLFSFIAENNIKYSLVFANYQDIPPTVVVKFVEAARLIQLFSVENVVAVRESKEDQESLIPCYFSVNSCRVAWRSTAEEIARFAKELNLQIIKPSQV